MSNNFHVQCFSLNCGVLLVNSLRSKEVNGTLKELEKVFIRKNIVAVSFFQNCAIHPYS